MVMYKFYQLFVSVCQRALPNSALFCVITELRACVSGKAWVYIGTMVFLCAALISESPKSIRRFSIARRACMRVSAWGSLISTVLSCLYV